MRPVWPFVAAIAVLAQSSSLPQTPPRDVPDPPRGTASVSGRVLASDTRAPLAGAFVTLIPTERTDDITRAARYGRWAARADQRGRYVVTDLPAGRYALYVSPPAGKEMYLPTGLARRGDPRFAPRAIEVADGEVMKDIDVTLARGSVLSGRVLDEQGQPMMHVRVEALGRRSPGGEFVNMSRLEMTDDYGRYRLGGLPPGDYYVQAEGSQPGSTYPTDAAEHEAFLTSYYPGTANRSEAPVLTLGMSEEIADLDIRLVRGRTYSISGQVLDPQGDPAAGANVTLSYAHQGGTSGTGHMADAAGVFRFSRLPPGDYTLSARPADSSWERPDEGVAGVPVTIVATDVEHVTLAMHRGTTVHGQVVTAGGSLPSFDVSRLRVRLETPGSFGSRRLEPSPLDQDWRFSVDHVFAPAVVRVEGGLPRGWFLQAVRYRDQDVTDIPTAFEFDPTGRDLRIVLGDRPATLRGAVRDAAGRSVPAAQVLLFPTDAAPRPEPLMTPLVRTRFTLTGETGGYVLSPLAPGEYLVLAVDMLTVGPFSAGTDLATLAPHATRVTLLEGDDRTVDLRLADLRKE